MLSILCGMVTHAVAQAHYIIYMENHTMQLEMVNTNLMNELVTKPDVSPTNMASVTTN